VLAPNVSATPPVAYQWFENGALIEGARLSSLNLGQVTEADGGRVFTLLVGTPHGFALSADQELNVSADRMRPEIVSAGVSGMADGFFLTFSEPMDAATITNPANYSLSHGFEVTGLNLLYGTNLTTLVVQTSGFPTGEPLEVTVSNVRDLAAPPNEILPGSTVAVSLADGAITLRLYGLDFGNQLPLNYPTTPIHQAWFPDNPGTVTTRPEMGIPPNVSDNYIAQLIGYLVPPVTGEYRFLVAADDQAIVHLSTDPDPGNKVAIAVEPQWNPYRDYTSTTRRRNTGAPGGLIQENFPDRDPGLAANDSANTVGPIHLEAGRRYYFEAFMIDGGGGDNLDVTWVMPGDTRPVQNGQAPVPGEFLAPWDGSGFGGPAVITTQPADDDAIEGRLATFQVKASGVPEFEYQWFRNGVRIVDATSAVLEFPTRLSDKGAHYSVRVRNRFSETWSDEAILNVRRDGDSPQIIRTFADRHFDKVTLVFDEPVTAASATNALNYSITRSDNQLPLSVSGAEVRGYLNGGFINVVLRTGDIEPGVNYTVRASGVADLAEQPNLSNPNQPGHFTGWVLSHGFVLHERFSPIADLDVSSLRDADTFPDSPGSSQYLTSWETPYPQIEPVARLFGARTSGYVFPQHSGVYKFYTVASYAGGELWLSPDAFPANVELIVNATASPGGGRNFWEAAGPGNRSGEIPLQAGQSYYLESYFTGAGGNGDYLDVNWQSPGAPVPAPAPTQLRGDVIATWANLDGIQFGFSTEPQDSGLDAGTMVTFTLQVSAAGLSGQALPVIYQWQTNGVDVAGADGTSFTTPRLAEAHDGMLVRCLVSAPGATVASRTAVISVTPSEIGYPILVTGSPGLNRVFLEFESSSFGQPPSGIGDPANYAIDGLNVYSVEVSQGGWLVTLHTSPQEPGRDYLVKFPNINPGGFALRQAPFAAWKWESGWVLTEQFHLGSAATLADLEVSPERQMWPNFNEDVDFEIRNFGISSKTGYRLSGWLKAPVSGEYDFYLAASSPAVFRLDDNASTATLRTIVAEPEGQQLRDYTSLEGRINSPANAWFPDVTDAPVNQSPHTVGPVFLEADTDYYFELLVLSSAAEHHGSVVMVPSGDPVPADGTPGFSGMLVSNHVRPDSLATMLTSPPTKYVPDGTVVMIDAVGFWYGYPTRFQWQRNGVDLPGETSGRLTFTATPENHGARYRCRMSVPGRIGFTRPVLLAVDEPPFGFYESDESVIIEFPPILRPVTVQSTGRLSEPLEWTTVGRLAPNPETKRFVFPKSGQHRYFRVRPQ